MRSTDADQSVVLGCSAPSHILNSVMEDQIRAIAEAVTNIQSDQSNILTRLESIDVEIQSLKTQDSAIIASVSQLSQCLSGQVSGEAITAGVAASQLPNAAFSHSPFVSDGTAVQRPNAQHAVTGNVITVQDEFQAIKDKVSGIKIPQELRVGTSRTGIRREDTPAANIISNCAKYVETKL